MATRKNAGNVSDLTLEVLKQIRDEVRQTNSRLDQMNGRLDRHEHILELHGQALTKLIHEVAGLNGRFDNFLTGSHGRSHTELEDRVSRIEDWIAKRAS